MLLACLLSACSAQIQHGLDERDANEIISVLVGRGFKAAKVPEKGKKPTWAIEVDDEHATEAMRVLTELKLPRPARPTTRSLTASPGLIETASAERLRQVEGQEGDLEEALETMDGVSSASVELVVPPPPRPGTAATPSKAAVLLRVRPEARERVERQVGQLRALVAGAVDGLSPEAVVLVIDEVGLAPAVAEVSPRPANGLRALVIGLGLALSVLSGVVVVLALRGRKASVSVEPAAPKVTPVLQRKAA
jgi:type III secretion protein J